MHERRASHTATLLPTGKVLIAGGFKKVRTYDQFYFDSAELYDPRTKTFSPTGTLHEARCGHTATLLQNGTVLITGGVSTSALSSAELYDPHKETFTSIGNMIAPREGHTATLLRNGNVLIAGGNNDAAKSAEIFNVKTRRFEQTGNLNATRMAHTATLLPDGNVLIAGGTNRSSRDHPILATAELYNTNTGKFASTGSMTMVRYKHASLLLPDGNVLIAGGSDDKDWQGQYNSAELYDIERGSFSRIADMQAKRFKLPQAAALLKDGSVLISGGSTTIETYDPKTSSFAIVAQFDEPHFYQTATLLPDGGVLVAGGYNTQPQSTDKAWIIKK
jgi:WD40 repeat protein